MSRVILSLRSSGRACSSWGSRSHSLLSPFSHSNKISISRGLLAPGIQLREASFASHRLAAFRTTSSCFRLQQATFSDKPASEPKGLENSNKVNDDETKISKTAPISWRALVVAVVIGTGIVLYYRYFKAKSRPSMAEVDSIGKALLGGPFDLFDVDGKRVTSEMFKGKYVLLYFGFTFCPDICPDELRKMQKALKDLNLLKGMPEVVPVFITIDPDRDTPDRLKEYRKSWSPDIHWLTGSKEKIDEAAKAYRVYYSIPTEDEKMGDNDYLVDHSIFFYLLNPEGEFMEFFGKNLKAEEVTLKMAKALRKDIMNS